MIIEKVVNLIGVTEFTSKDGSKKFHNAKLLADDIVLDCAFIKQSDYDILSKGKNLDKVKCEFDLSVAGVDSSNKSIYSIRLLEVQGFVNPNSVK